MKKLLILPCLFFAITAFGAESGGDAPISFTLKNNGPCPINVYVNSGSIYYLVCTLESKENKKSINLHSSATYIRLSGFHRGHHIIKHISSNNSDRNLNLELSSIVGIPMINIITESK